MKSILIHLDDEQYLSLDKKKGSLTWKQLLLKGADLPYGEEMGTSNSKTVK